MSNVKYAGDTILFSFIKLVEVMFRKGNYKKYENNINYVLVWIERWTCTFPSFLHTNYLFALGFFYKIIAALLVLRHPVKGRR